MTEKALTADWLKKNADVCRNDKLHAAMTRALSRAAVSDLAYNTTAAAQEPFEFSCDIPTMKVTNQRSSGRCWLFAALNVLRERVGRELNVDQFEFSQSWCAFWDKLERCNYYFECILETADLPLTDRVVDFIIRSGISDGGQWDMFVNIVNKYGLVPKSAFPETATSSGTGECNRLLNQALRHAAAKLRKMKASGASEETLRAYKDERMKEIYDYLTACYGELPTVFDYEYKDKDGKICYLRGMTPETFRDRFCGSVLTDTVSIIHAPTADKPYDKTYTIQYLGNVVGGKDVVHLNLTLAEFKAAVIAQMKDGNVVWFGSDCGKYSGKDNCLWDPAQYDYEAVTPLKLTLTKEEGLDYHYSAMNHAMVLCGVHLDEEGNPVRWKIQNSWGDRQPNAGYYVASDEWFDSFVYQAAIDKKYLGAKVTLTEQEPVVLAPWDPMGTLAE